MMPPSSIQMLQFGLTVMPGLVPGIHGNGKAVPQFVDGRDEPGHDERNESALEQLPVARTAERDATLQRKTAIRFTHPPPRWGRVGVRVTDRLAVGVMPRTDPW